MVSPESNRGKFKHHGNPQFLENDNAKDLARAQLENKIAEAESAVLKAEERIKQAAESDDIEEVQNHYEEMQAEVQRLKDQWEESGFDRPKAESASA